MSPKSILRFLPMLTLFGACLENLHEQKYFDTLKRTNPALYEIVTHHKEKIETQLRDALHESLTQEPREISLWGAHWEHVRTPVEGEILYMKGRILYPKGPSDTYALRFQITTEGDVQILDRNVYKRSASSNETNDL